MIFLVEFDGTIVDGCRAFNDLDTPMHFLPFAKEGLEHLRNRGHKLILFSVRANRAAMESAMLDPGMVETPALLSWEQLRPIHQMRWEQMLVFVDRFLPGIFDYVDEGRQGKPAYDVSLDGNSPFWPSDAWLAIMRAY